MSKRIEQVPGDWIKHGNKTDMFYLGSSEFIVHKDWQLNNTI